jgi:hypothetical protein
MPVGAGLPDQPRKDADDSQKCKYAGRYDAAGTETKKHEEQSFK